MKLHYLAPVLVFILLLFGLVSSASSQTTSSLFGSTRGVPTRLFGSTDNLDYVPQFAQKTSYGCEQKRCRRPTIVFGCKSSCGCETSCGCVPRNSCDTGCKCNSGRSCGLRGLSRALGKLNGAVKGLFRCNRSSCCDPCCYQTRCCPIRPSYGYELGCGCEPGGLPMPVPEAQPETPSLEGNPFEDDPVQLLAPPIPSQTRRETDRRSPIGTVTYTRPAKRIGTNSPARFRPDSATPIKRQIRLTRSVLDRVD